MSAWFILAGLLVILLFLSVLFFNAPEGYEDADGFHYGRKEKK